MGRPASLDPTDEVLERVPGRTFKFLSAVSTSRVIAALLAPHGLTKAVIAHGWDLLHAVSGYAPPTGTAPSVDVAPEVQAALVEIDAFDEPTFAIANGALALAYPSACAFLFAGDLHAAQGRESVNTVGTFLRRLDALESGKGRPKDEHKTDKAAVAKLAERGITSKVRDHMKALLKLVEVPDEEPTAIDAPAKGGDPKRRKALLALHAFYFEWSEVARAVIKRRDYLIRLGLAKRNPPTKKGSGDAAAAAAGGTTASAS